MVPEAVDLLDERSYANTLLAKTPPHPLKRFPIPLYRPRDGRGAARDAWEHAIYAKRSGHDDDGVAMVALSGGWHARVSTDCVENDSARPW